MLRVLVILLTVLMFSPNTFACHYSDHQDTSLYQVFNHLFTGRQALSSDLELFNTQGINLVADDTLWGAPGDAFSIDLTYAGSRHQDALGIMGDQGYQELVDLSPYRKHTYVTHDDAEYVVSQGDENGFMWVDAAGKDRKGTKIYSDADYNYHEKDLFMAFSISDSRMLDYYYSLYGSDDTEKLDELCLIAFDGADRKWGDFTDLVAVVSWVGGVDPVPTPIPGAALLLASGSGLLFWRRRSVV